LNPNFFVSINLYSCGTRSYLKLLSRQGTAGLRLIFFSIALLPLGLTGGLAEAADDYDFFEKRIRPVLIQHCYDCHSHETEVSGGLGVDSRQGLLTGGQLGPALRPGNRLDSLLWQAISYQDSGLRMPPDGKLDATIIEDIGRWIDLGAPDPRETPSSPEFPKAAGSSESPIEIGSMGQTETDVAFPHWAFSKSPSSGELPIELQDRSFGSAVDFWIDRKLDTRQLRPNERASDTVLARRLYFDLIGLPPTPEQLNEFLQDPRPDRVEHLIDRLLDSPHFGEVQARHWMDVVRYADSITLRGFILPEAWRYRDYLIESFNQDRSFRELVEEQIAGDLLSSDTPQQRARQLVATTFLALGNTNLEQQDKLQLELDYLDEQLDVIGSSFLGMTISCARCHDHKFDPIPTRDYYAMGGILRSSSGLRHDNVSQWVELPLPLSEDQESRFEELAGQKERLQRKIDELKMQLGGTNNKGQGHLSIGELPGIIVDNSQAMLVGKWIPSQHTLPIVGKDYLHDGNERKGEKSITFEPDMLPPGEYEVRLAYQYGENRASKVPVKVFSADGEKEFSVNQRVKPTHDGLWISLGHYRFEANGQALVLIGNADTDGHVIADAVQYIPLNSISLSLSNDSNSKKSKTASPELPDEPEFPDETALRVQLASLEEQLHLVQKELNQKPMYMTVRESHESTRMSIQIRGNAHRRGQEVPRGFLTAIPIDLAVDSPDRLDLARWICHPQNPLTSRVYVNRIWLNLMGRGIVETPNNFGATGVPPTHPELLDWLALRLVNSDWSTKTIVKEIVSSTAYQRRSDCVNEPAEFIDPENQLYWRGQLRRISVEALRDSMLMISGELDLTMGGNQIRMGTKTDYNYFHDSVLRSVYQPVFRNSLPSLYDAFDFADPSVSIGKRARTTGVMQGLALTNDPWIRERARAAAYRASGQALGQGWETAINHLYLFCFGRPPTNSELEISQRFIDGRRSGEPVEALEQLIWSLFASIDFRYLD
jgi:hypothetical protein